MTGNMATTLGSREFGVTGTDAEPQCGSLKAALTTLPIWPYLGSFRPGGTFYETTTHPGRSADPDRFMVEYDSFEFGYALERIKIAPVDTKTVCV
jgi:hypothetical protein